MDDGWRDGGMNSSNDVLGTNCKQDNNGNKTSKKFLFSVLGEE